MKNNPIVRFFRAIWSGLDGIRKVLHLIVLLFLFAILFAGLSGNAPILPSQAALRIEPAGTLVEELAGDALDRALEELTDTPQSQTLVQDIVDSLSYAKTDSRVTAVHMELSSLGGSGLSKLQQVADAMLDFRESGKPLIATADFYTQQAYYLAAHADEVYMHPEGLLFLQGFGSFRNYFADAIDKLKLDWNIFRVGTHKSFVEPFTRMDMSPEDRELTGQLVDELWSIYRTDVRVARNLTDGTVQNYADNFVELVKAVGGDPARVAISEGLVDDLLTHAEVRELLIAQVGADDHGSYRSMDMNNYLPQARLLDTDRVRDENVAIVVASGNILAGSQPPGSIGASSTSELLRRARNDDSVRAVVIRIDSPGGSAFASDVIANEIEALQVAGKPVVASMASVAASGGYWIASGADQIFASPSTITGSIGIFGMFPTYQRTAASLGVATDGVGTTQWSGQFRPDREMSDAARGLFQLVIEDGYQDFIQRVADYREMSLAEVDAIAQGKVWTGNAALELGLVDELGALEDAVRAAAELAGLDDGTYGQFHIKTQLSPTEQFFVDLLSASAAMMPRFSRETSLERVAGELEKLLIPLTQFNDPKGVYSHCFCTVE